MVQIDPILIHQKAWVTPIKLKVTEITGNEFIKFT